MPWLEAKFSRIIEDESGITVTVRIYRTTGPNTTIDPVTGQDLVTYNRTLVREETRTLPAGTTKAQIVGAIKARVSKINADLSLGFADGDILVSLG